MLQKKYRLCLQFCLLNLKNPLRKVFGFLGIYSIVIAVVTMMNRSNGCSMMDSLVLLNGGYNTNSINLKDVLVSLLPYAVILYVCSAHLEQMLAEKGQFVRIRLKKLKYFYVSNLMTNVLLSCIAVILFDFSKYIVCLGIYHNENGESAYCVSNVLSNLTCDLVFCQSLLYHIIGIVAIICIQYMIIQLTQNNLFAMLLGIFVVFINLNVQDGLLDFLCIGNIVMIGKMDIIAKTGCGIKDIFCKNAIYCLITLILVVKGNKVGKRTKVW